jgi:hypothetical protein
VTLHITAIYKGAIMYWINIDPAKLETAEAVFFALVYSGVMIWLLVALYMFYKLFKR